MKSTIKQARKNKRKNGRAVEDGDLDLSGSEGDEDVVEEDSFDSEDSDADEHRNKKATGLQKILQEKCVKLLNELTLEDLGNVPKFNDRVANFIVEKRPFEDFDKATEIMRKFPRGTVFLEAYLEFLEKRSILDEVLDDCKRYSQTIEDSLKKIQDKQLLVQPKTLNPECKLHPYQQGWLLLLLHHFQFSRAQLAYNDG